MRMRIVYVLWLIGFSIMASALPAQPAQATAQTAFSSTPTYFGGYSTTYFQMAFTFLTNTTLDELTGIDLILAGSSPMTLSLYTSDAAGNRGTFVTTIATTMLGATGIHTFTPTAPIFLQPNSYYWVQTEITAGNIVIGSDLPTSDYYTYQTTWLYDVLANTFYNVSTVAPRVTMRVDTVDPLTASATCIGADLQVTISAGDNPFQITADSGTLLTGLGIGTHTITGPVNETNVNVTELAGNTENFPLGNFDCFVSETLSATAACVGADLQITISNGNAPFSISVTDSIGTMNSGGNPLGVYTFTGPDTFTNIGITEDTGDLEVLNLPDVTCTAPVVPPPPVAPVVLSPDLTALGCVLTQEVLAPTAPDNTYCRVLMKNGSVVNYAGAVPQNLIDLGVIFAVDVYRLDGGQSITDFPNYTRVCLLGAGRLFYLDARTSPRVQVELQTETEGNFTCGWIPAAGTVVLTR